MTIDFEHGHLRYKISGIDPDYPTFTKMKTLVEHFISCDWGTTNFRLRLVETQSLQVMAEHQTGQGIRDMYEKFRNQKAVDRLSFYIHYLREQVTKLPFEDAHYPVVISGMASSNLGLQELPYAGMPFGLNGSGLNWQHITTNEGMNLWLISGVKSEDGIMRGEETQAIGLQQHLEPFSEGILLLPGTHSKHLTFNKGKFTGLKNFMTGEIFELMSCKSILANSVSKSRWNPDREKAFISGLKLGLKGGLTSNMFSIRANHVLKDTSKQDNYYQLSGMIIGDELSYLEGHKGIIVLAAPDPVFSFYQTALKQLILSEHLVLLNENDLAQALLIGQKKILELNER